MVTTSIRFGRRLRVVVQCPGPPRHPHPWVTSCQGSCSPPSQTLVHFLVLLLFFNVQCPSPCKCPHSHDELLLRLLLSKLSASLWHCGSSIGSQPRLQYREFIRIPKWSKAFLQIVWQGKQDLNKMVVYIMPPGTFI